MCSAIKTSACAGVVSCLDYGNELFALLPAASTAGLDKPFRITAASLIFLLFFAPSLYSCLMAVFI